MKPPQDLVQGKPSYKLNSGKYTPKLQTNQPTFEPQLANKLMDSKVKDEYIPSPMKMIGMPTNPYEISLACRSVNDLRKVVRGNGTFFDKQLVNASPISALSKQAFTDDRIGTFGMNPKQTPITIHTF
jgi:hypothetical protein